MVRLCDGVRGLLAWENDVDARMTDSMIDDHILWMDGFESVFSFHVLSSVCRLKNL